MKANVLNSPVIYPVDRDPNKEWYVQYPDPSGKGFKKKYGKLKHCHTLEEKTAEAERIIREDLAHLHLARVARNTIDLAAQVQEFHEYQCVGLRDKSITTYTTYVQEFCVWYRTKWRRTDNTIMGLEFIRYLKEQKGVGNTTANNYRCVLKSLFAKLVKMGRFPLNPFENTNKLKERRQTREWFRQEQIDKIRKVLVERDPQLWLGCRLQFYCFIRPCAELPMLKISDIEIADARIRIASTVSKKGSDTEYVSIPAHMLGELAELCNYPKHYFLFGPFGKPHQQRMNKTTMSKRHQAIMKELGLPANYTYYSWKNTGAVMMLKHDCGLLQISMQMRHKSLDYTREYFKSLGFNDLAEDFNRKLPKL